MYWKTDIMEWTPPDIMEWTLDKMEWTPDIMEWTPDKMEWTPEIMEWTPDKMEWPPDIMGANTRYGGQETQRNRVVNLRDRMETRYY